MEQRKPKGPPAGRRPTSERAKAKAAAEAACEMNYDEAERGRHFVPDWVTCPSLLPKAPPKRRSVAQ